MKRTILALMAAAFLASCSSDPAPETQWIGACREAVVDKLKSPSTAEFPGEESIREWEEDGKSYEVAGPVDSQNGFGATVRSNFRCIVQAADRSVTGVYIE